MASTGVTYNRHLEQAMRLFDECWQKYWEDKALDHF
jgi:hypothetical protein